MKQTELDEATALALAALVHNHIEALKVWERKLRVPFMPTTSHHLSVVPPYPKPTLNSALHIAKSSSAFEKQLVTMVLQLLRSGLMKEKT